MPTDTQTPSARRKSSPGSVLFLSVVIAALALALSGRAFVSLLVGLAAFVVLSALTILAVTAGAARTGDVLVEFDDRLSPAALRLKEVLLAVEEQKLLVDESIARELARRKMNEGPR